MHFAYRFFLFSHMYYINDTPFYGILSHNKCLKNIQCIDMGVVHGLKAFVFVINTNLHKCLLFTLIEAPFHLVYNKINSMEIHVIIAYYRNG